MNAGTKIFLVVLRVAIGWHFFYEGMYKLTSERAGAQPFTAQHFLGAARGPAADFYRGMVKDGDGLERLTKGAASKALDDRFRELVDFYGFTNEIEVDDEDAPDGKRRVVTNQVKKLEAERERLREAVQAKLDSPEFKDQLEGYQRLLKVHADNTATLTAPFTVERNLADQGKVDTMRRELLLVVTEPLRLLDREARLLRVRPKGGVDQMALGAPPRRASQTELIDRATKWGLSIVGFCLMIGFFPRLAALGGAAILGMFYMAWPPFPGIPDPPMSTGHFLIVNPLLIEFLAVLVLATVPTGRWAGLSSFVQYFVLDPLRPPAVPAPVAQRLLPESGATQAGGGSEINS